MKIPFFSKVCLGIAALGVTTAVVAGFSPHRPNKTEETMQSFEHRLQELQGKVEKTGQLLNDKSIGQEACEIGEKVCCTGKTVAELTGEVLAQCPKRCIEAAEECSKLAGTMKAF